MLTQNSLLQFIDTVVTLFVFEAILTNTLIVILKIKQFLKKKLDFTIRFLYVKLIP